MTEDEIKAWFFKYGQYANGRDMALIHAIAEAVAQPRQWVGLTDEDQQELYDAWIQLNDGWGSFYALIEAKLKEKNT